MLAGVFLHAGLPYGAHTRKIWLVGEPGEGSAVIESFIWFLHLFRMPLFFLLSGFFANLLIERRGVKGFIRNRALRLAAPFVIFAPLLGVSMFLMLPWMVEQMPGHPPMLLVEELMSGEGQAPVSTGHLWFIYNLMFFCAIAAALSNLRWPWVDRVAAAFYRSTGHLVYAPLLLLPALYTTAIPLPPPDRLAPQLFAYGYHGIFFFAGWHLYRNRDYLDLIERRLWPLAVVSMVGLVAFHVRMPPMPSGLDALRMMVMEGPPADTGAVQFINATLEAYLSVYLTLIMLVLGRRFLSAESRALRYVSDASYWIYLIHLTLLFLIETWLLRFDLSVWIKFGVASFGTLAIGLITYELGVRYTPIGTMLNGKKQRSRSLPRSQSAAAE